MWMKSNDLKLVKLRQTKGTGRAWDQTSSTLHDLILSIPSCSRIFVNRDAGVARGHLEASWRQVLQRALSNPEEISLLDNRGRTALHCACAKRPPLQVVRVLLTSSGNDDAHIESFLLKKDNHGRIPIHASLANHAALDVMRYLLHRCEKSAEVTDNAHNLPLHVACMGDFDQDRAVIVQDLIEAFRDGAGIFSRAGKTPLSLAVECGGSLNVIHTLLEAYPQSLAIRGSGDTPLQIAIKNNSDIDIINCLMKGDPSVVKMVDDSGATPLHQAIEFRCPVEVVRVLLSDSSDIVLATNRTGCTPVHAAIKHRIRPYEVVKELVRKCPKVVHCRNKAGDNPLDLVYARYIKCIECSIRDRKKEIKKSLWRTLVLILRIYKTCSVLTDGLDKDDDKDDDDDELVEKKGEDNDMKSILHLMLQTNVPYEIVDLTLDRDPGAIRCFDKRSKCLPIFHLANSAARHREQIMSMMLRRYPSCTKVKDGGSGDLLLGKVAEYAVLSAKLFCEIVAANPNALEVPDSRTGLYPFMLAATPKRKELNADKEHAFSKQFEDWGFVQNQDHLQLDAVYTLMREKPDFVELAIL